MRSSRTNATRHSGALRPRHPAIAAALLAITLTVPAVAARSAGATDLDLAPAPTFLRIASAAGSWDSAFRPIRHRHAGYGAPLEYYATLGVGSFGPSHQPGSGLYLNGSVGSTLQRRLDLGMQISWYHHSTGGSTYVREYQDPAGITRRDVIETEHVDTDLVPIMVTLRARFPLTPGVEPYVGGGVGWEWLTIQGMDVAGYSFKDDYDGFGGQVLGGVNVAVTPDVAVYGEAVWNLSTVSADFFDPIIAATVHEEVGFDGIGGHAGLRFRF